MEEFKPDKPGALGNLGLDDKVLEPSEPQGPFWEVEEITPATDILLKDPTNKKNPNAPVTYYYFKIKDHYYASNVRTHVFYPLALPSELVDGVEGKPGMKAKKRQKNDTRNQGNVAVDQPSPDEEDETRVCYVPQKVFNQWLSHSWDKGRVMGAGSDDKLDFVELRKKPKEPKPKPDSRDKFGSNGRKKRSKKAGKKPTLLNDQGEQVPKEEVEKAPPHLQGFKHKEGERIQHSFSDIRNGSGALIGNGGTLRLKLDELYKGLILGQKLAADDAPSNEHDDRPDRPTRYGSMSQGFCYEFQHSRAKREEIEKRAPADSLYVKMHSNQFDELYLAGGRTRLLDEIYIPKRIMDILAGLPGRIPDSPKDSTMSIEEDKPAVAKKQSEETEEIRKVFENEEKLWIRNEFGEAFELAVEKAGLNDEAWKARYCTAARSIESTASGWNRCINPVLDLFLVPVSPQHEGRLRDWVKTAEEKRAALQEKKKAAQTVSVENSQTVNANTGYHHLGTSPFGHYETWIKADKWDEYVKNYPTREMPLDKARMAELKNAIKSKEEHDLVKNAFKHSGVKKDGTFYDEDSITILVSAKKINDAKGKRDACLSQKAVMGGVSATEIAKLLKWSNAGSIVAGNGIYPSTGVWPAEWLHRNAFSWGGLGETSTQPWATSQIRENLVFGSSEANSMMTRYEKAWQELVSREGREDSKLKFKLTTETRSPKHEIKVATPGGQKKIPVPSYKEYEAPRWICYALDYRLDWTGSGNLAVSETPLEAVFFPFERSFFTLYEQELDAIILDALCPRKKDEVLGAAQLAGPDKIQGRARTLQDVMKAVDESMKGTNNLDLPPFQAVVQVDNGIQEELLVSDEASPESQLRDHDNDFYSSQSQDNGGTLFLQLHDSQQQQEKLKSSSMAFEIVASNFNIPELKMDTVVTKLDDTANADSPSQQDVAGESPQKLATAEEIHQEVWDELQKPGPTAVDGLLLANSAIVTAADSWIPVRGLSNIATTSGSDSMASFEPITDLQQISLAKSSNAMPGLHIVMRPPSEIESDSQMATSSHSSGSSTGVFWSPAEEKSDALSVLTVPDEESTSEQKSLAELPICPEPVFEHLETQEPARIDSGLVSGTAPREFVLKGSFNLFGNQKLPVELYSLQSANVEGIHHFVSVPGELSLGKLVPSLADSPMNAIKLFNTSLGYHSSPTSTERAGVTLTTVVYLTGFLQPVNTVLSGIFGQEKPHIDVSGLLATEESGLTEVPNPKGFRLRGELPGVNITLFNALNISHLGLDIMGTRISSRGGYRYSFGFLGQGKIADASVAWYLSKYGNSYSITIVTESDTWTNVGGITGVNLNNVFFQASWTGTNLSSVALSIEATLELRTGSLALRGEYSRSNLEVAGMLSECTLETLRDIYEDIFQTTVSIDTNHEVLFSALEFVVSSRDGLHLRGAVTVDGHTSATASITLNSEGIRITGAIQNPDIEFLPKLERASIDLRISKASVAVQLAATAVIEGQHKFDVSIYLDKSSGEKLEYTVYGGYQGDFYLRQLMDALEGTFLDLKLLEVAICASNMNEPKAQIETKLLQYDIKKGLQVYAQVESIDAINQLLRVEKSPPLTLCAFYTPGKKAGFGVKLLLPTENVMSFGCMRSGKLTIGVTTSDVGPRLSIATDLFIDVKHRKDPLKLELELAADVEKASGSAFCDDTWENPLNLCKTLSVGKIKAGLGVIYRDFLATGTPSSVTIGGEIKLGDFVGSMLLQTGSNPKEQLVRLEITNLDLAALISVIAKLVEFELAPPPNGKDTLFIKHLLVYLSTGVQIKDDYFAPGVELDVSLVVFGKNAKMHAVISESKAAFSGSIDSFTLGDVEVTGARGKGNPCMDMEFSKDVKKFSISGRVSIKDNYVSLEIRVDTGKEEFFFEFKLVIVDVLTVEVKASLEGSIPPAIKEIKESPESGEKTISVTDNAFSGRQFNLDAYVEQDILNYLINLINHHFEKEGDPNRESVLKNELEKARTMFNTAEAAYQEKAKSLKTVIDEKQAEWDAKVNKVAADRDTAQKQFDGRIEIDEKDQRELSIQIGYEKQKIEEDEHIKTISLVEAATAARVAVLDCSRELAVIKDFKISFDKAVEDRDFAEVEVAGVTSECQAHVANEPALTDVAHAAWQWVYQELLVKQAAKQSLAISANAQVAIAQALFNEEYYQQTTQRLKMLEEAAAVAEAASLKQQEMAAQNVKSAQAACDQKLRMLVNKRKEEQRCLREKLDGLMADAKTTKEDSDAAMKKCSDANSLDQTTEHEEYQKARMARDKAQVAQSSFSDLKHIINIFGDVFTRPLRFSIKALGGKLFNIKSMRIKGRWGGKSSKITANLKGTIGFQSFDFDLSWDMTDITDFLRGIWMKVGEIIDAVGNFIAKLWKQGIEAIKAAAEALKKGVVQGVIAVKETFDSVGKDMEEFMDDVRSAAKKAERAFLDIADDMEKDVHKITQALGHAGEVVADAFVDAAKDIAGGVEKGVDAVVEVAKDIGEGVEKGVDAVVDVAKDIGEVVEKGVEAVVDVAKDIGDGVEKGVDAVVDVAKDVGDGVEKGVQALGDGAEDLVDDVGSVAGDIGRGIETAAGDVAHGVVSAAEDVGGAVVSVTDDVGDAFIDAGSAVGGFASDVGGTISGWFS